MFLVGVCAAIILLMTAGMVFAQTITVTGSGMNQNEALRDAIRQAVEQTIGALVSSETLVKNAAVLEDTVYAKSQGYVKSYQILRTEERGEDVFVTAVIEVDAQPGSELMQILTTLNDPRIVVLIQEKSSDGYKESKICENHIVQSMLDAGFKRVIDARQALAGNSAFEKSNDIGKDIKALAALAKETGADYLIVGSANVNASAEVTQMLGYGGTSGMYSFQGVLEARLYKSDTGIVVAATSTNGVSLEITAVQGMQSALLEASQKMAEYLVGKLKGYAAMAVKSVQISVKATGYAEVEALKRALSRVPGVNSVYLRTYQDGTALLDVDYSKSAQNLWRDLERSLDVNVMMQSATENRLDLIVM